MKEASQPVTISSSQPGNLTSPGPCCLLHMHLQGIVGSWACGSTTNPGSLGRALAGLTKRLGGARDTNGVVGVNPFCHMPAGGHGGKGSWKASRRIMLCVVVSQQGSPTQALVYIQWI